jgi:glutathione S-transferase
MLAREVHSGQLRRTDDARHESPDPHVLAILRRRLDDFLDVAEQHFHDRSFVVGDRTTVPDLSIVGYLFFPKEESGYDLAVSHPAVHGWLARIAALPGWHAPYDLLPGKRLRRYT